MKKLMLMSAVVLGLLGSAPSTAADAPNKAREASIPFVGFGTIRNFRALDRDTLYVQDQRRNWYRAELIGPCSELPWAEAIGFETRGTNRLDRFSSVIVRGQRCQLISFTESAGPPKKRKASKA